MRPMTPEERNSLLRYRPLGLDEVEIKPSEKRIQEFAEYLNECRSEPTDRWHFEPHLSAFSDFNRLFDNYPMMQAPPVILPVEKKESFRSAKEIAQDVKENGL